MDSDRTATLRSTQETDLSQPWFSDGNITLIAGDSSFRVYKSLLAAQSTFFRDLFSSASDDGLHDSDGLPVLQLHDDPAELSCFLRAIFDSSFFNAHPSDPIPTTTTIVVVLRLSHKYDVRHLRRRALLHAERLVPATYAAFRAGGFINRPADTFYLLADVAIEVGADWLLPAALEAGSRHLVWLREHRHTFHEYQEVLERCVAGLSAIQQAGHDRLALFDAADAECVCLSKRCRRTFQKVKARYASSCMPATGIAWQNIEAELRASVCAQCRELWRERDTEWAINYWNSLPVVYGLGGWDRLQRIRDEDLKLDEGEE
ncbi:uncharacterized protein SCHCODRAFT_02695950 [Schizophyllum commune H4-8]|nr:uncharacterized protein SCHCODRAFT_02695950 [Schizophyllum commune H4-8]KAI5900791.1 hypothetical protein SCHCODRAFT_02695950 [Schizophyllum commune H4-8]